jgi:methylthioribose-1-phosphate isomerase
LSPELKRASCGRVIDEVVAKAESMLADDVAANKAMGEYGSEAILQAAKGAGSKLRVMTHCNAGMFAINRVNRVI